MYYVGLEILHFLICAALRAHEIVMVLYRMTYKNILSLVGSYFFVKFGKAQFQMEKNLFDILWCRR